MSNTNVIIEFIQSLKEIEAQIKELEAEATAIRDMLKSEMTESGVDELLVGDFKLTYREVVSNRFDSTNFKKAYAELYKQFTKTTNYRRLTIN